MKHKIFGCGALATLSVKGVTRIVLEYDTRRHVPRRWYPRRGALYAYISHEIGQLRRGSEGYVTVTPDPRKRYDAVLCLTPSFIYNCSLCQALEIIGYFSQHLE